MMPPDPIRMRLLRDDDAPPSPDGSAVRFGLQDNKGRIVEGARGTDGRFRFDFELVVRSGPDARPVFTGPFASGSREERFVYLSWQRLDGGGYVNRIKARLKDIDWPLIRVAQASGKALEADMSGRRAGGGTVPVEWRLAED
ncbi:MAG TPA: DUF5990 family protein [Allosphingosinicella sp.]|nr:DUF5990 family protein [Allosphingosinicella sp.]